MEALNSHKCEPLKKVEKADEYFYWNSDATLGLLAAYNAMQPDKKIVKKHKNFWQDIAKELQRLGYNVTADQTRWKFNALLRKYKQCVGNNSTSRRNPMKFAYFNEMQDMFEHRKNIHCNHEINSSLFGSKRQSSSFVESDQEITVIRKRASSSSTFKSLPTKISKRKCQWESLNKTSPSETSSCETPSFFETPPSEKIRKSQAGSTTVANTKLELEKQWLKYLEVLAEKNQKDDEKLKKMEEELQLKKKRLLWKEMVVNRKMQEKEERHRERMRIENEKCQLLKQLIESIGSNSVNNVLSIKK